MKVLKDQETETARQLAQLASRLEAMEGSNAELFASKQTLQDSAVAERAATQKLVSLPRAGDVVAVFQAAEHGPCWFGADAGA